MTRTSEEKPAENGHSITTPDRPIDGERLILAWEEFAELRKGQAAEYQLLKRSYVVHNNNIILSLNNPIQEPLLLGIRTSLIAFLRERLGNGSVMVTGVLEASETQKVIYTNREKFEHLAEQNPVLRDLKERFGLDTDF